MEKHLFSFKTILIAGLFITGFTACNKEKSDLTSSTPDVQSAQSLYTANVEDDNVQLMADQAQSEGGITQRTAAPVDNSAVDLITSCVVVTRDTVSTTRVVTIDFGTGCTNNEGVTRKGKIIITYTGHYRDPGSTVHITTQGYYVNENKIDINRTVINNGENHDGNLTFTVHSIRTVTYPDGTTSSSTVDRTREWIAGANTPHDFTDDVWRITGTTTHTSRTGVVYDGSTVTPLIRKVSCHQFVSGIEKVVRHAEHTKYFTIDFGTGVCDNKATVTLDNGKSYTIKLHSK